MPYTWMTALWVSSFLVIGSSLMVERPWLLTIGFSLWTMDIILQARAGYWTNAYWLLPLGYVLWANVHIQFIYGLALLGLAVVAPVLDQWLKLPAAKATAQSFRSDVWWKLVCLSVICFLATLVNPYHYHLYEVVLDYASQAGAFQYVSELRAPGFRNVTDWLAMMLLAGSLFALGRCWPVSTFAILLVVGTAFAGLRAVRDLWYLALGAISVLSFYVPKSLQKHSQIRMTRNMHIGWLVLAWGLALGLPWLLKPVEFANQENKQYPALAVQHVRGKQYPGPLFNHFDWGGYLIWRLPEYPVAMDGRTNLHGDRRIADSLNTWTCVTPLPEAEGKPSTRLNWDQNPDFRSANLIIAQIDMPLTNLLRLHPAFVKVYEDQRAVVFIRRGQQP